MRDILRQFGTNEDQLIPLRTDRMTLSPPAGFPPNEQVANHIDRLVTVGILRRTHEIHMTNHPDPVTLRATDQGREWVRYSHDDVAWARNEPTLQRIISGGDEL